MALTGLTYAEIDRLFYEKLRLAVVAANRLPNITAYLTADDYQAARDSLRESLPDNMPLIEVAGVGSWADRDGKNVSRIVIDRKTESPGSIGGFPATHIEAISGTGVDTKFEKTYYPDRAENLEYEIRIISYDADDDRLLSAIMKNTLKSRRFYNTVGNDGAETENLVLVVSQGSVDLSGRDFNERLYKFVVPDVFIESGTVINTNIPVLTSMNYQLYLIDSDMELTEEIIDVPQPANDNEWQDMTIDIPEFVTEVSSPYFTGDISQMIYISDQPLNRIKRGITKTGSDTLDFSSIVGIGGEGVYLSFQYRNLTN